MPPRKSRYPPDPYVDKEAAERLREEFHTIFYGPSPANGVRASRAEFREKKEKELKDIMQVCSPTRLVSHLLYVIYLLWSY